MKRIRQSSDIAYIKAKENSEFTFAQSKKIYMSQPKTHAHILLTQLDVKGRPKSRRTRGDEAILK